MQSGGRFENLGRGAQRYRKPFKGKGFASKIGGGVGLLPPRPLTPSGSGTRLADGWLMGLLTVFAQNK
jgi:hypothetical protein